MLRKIVQKNVARRGAPNQKALTNCVGLLVSFVCLWRCLVVALGDFLRGG